MRLTPATPASVPVERCPAWLERIFTAWLEQPTFASLHVLVDLMQRYRGTHFVTDTHVFFLTKLSDAEDDVIMCRERTSDEVRE